MDETSTIVACSSAPGRGLRAIVRVSGCDAFAIVARCAAIPRGRGVHRTRIAIESGSLPSLAYVLPGPRSFTGEDTVEFVCAGSVDLVREIEQALFAAAATAQLSCRPAQAGEFALRAFRNGRIDLTQAEGIAAAIAATNDAQLRAARHLADGGLAGFIARTADALADDLALVEAGIDFTDQEDVVAIEPSTLAAHLEQARAALDDHLARAVSIERIEGIPRVVLVGRPNAGKSSLFNALLGRPRAIASPEAGTTRDVLEERTVFVGADGPIEAILVDVAGLDGAAGTAIDRAMQARAGAAIRAADLLLHCVPVDEAIAAPPADGDAPIVVVRTKCDRAATTDDAAFRTSAATGEGCARLAAAIADRLHARSVAGEGELVALSARHERCLSSARDAMLEAHGIVVDRGLRSPELVAASMRSALDALGEASGRIAPDDVLGRIFGRFCIGK